MIACKDPRAVCRTGSGLNPSNTLDSMAHESLQPLSHLGKFLPGRFEERFITQCILTCQGSEKDLQILFMFIRIVPSSFLLLLVRHLLLLAWHLFLPNSTASHSVCSTTPLHRSFLHWQTPHTPQPHKGSLVVSALCKQHFCTSA